MENIKQNKQIQLVEKKQGIASQILTILNNNANLISAIIVLSCIPGEIHGQPSIGFSNQIITDQNKQSGNSSLRSNKKGHLVNKLGPKPEPLGPKPEPSIEQNYYFDNDEQDNVNTYNNHFGTASHHLVLQGMFETHTNEITDNTNLQRDNPDYIVVEQGMLQMSNDDYNGQNDIAYEDKKLSSGDNGMCKLENLDTIFGNSKQHEKVGQSGNASYLGKYKSHNNTFNGYGFNRIIIARREEYNTDLS